MNSYRLRRRRGSAIFFAMQGRHERGKEAENEQD
jgi:hypothetical protein